MWIVIQYKLKSTTMSSVFFSKIILFVILFKNVFSGNVPISIIKLAKKSWKSFLAPCFVCSLYSKTGENC